MSERHLWIDKATGHATNEQGGLIGVVREIGGGSGLSGPKRLIWNELGKFISIDGDGDQWERMAWELSVTYSTLVGFKP